MPSRTTRPELSDADLSGGQPLLMTPAGVAMAPYPGMVEPEGGGFDLSRLLAVLRRRRKPFVITLVLLTALQVGRTLHQRLVSPVFAGGFTLLISDPVNDQRGRGGSVGDGTIDALARNTASVDVPTLIQVLQSSAVLDPVFTQLAQEGITGRNRPSFSVGRVQSDAQASGVLRVNGRGSDLEALERGLQLTEQAYLSWSTQQRQERLTDGVRFLEEQEPRLRANTDALQEQVQRFREANTLVEPTEEAMALRSQMEALSLQLLGQIGEQRRLEELRADVAGGRLSARDFGIAGSLDSGGGAGGGGGSGTVAANLPNQAVLDELQRLEQEIAAAEANYQPGSRVLVSLKAARDQLLPQLREKQLEAVAAALRQNANAMATSRAQISRLEGQFQRQPQLLRQFEGLQQRLGIADGNLESYLRTREQFQLELAQNSTPWKVIASTTVNTTPVEPALGRGLLQGLLVGLAGGTGVALLRDRLDHVFHSPAEVSEELKVPLLGHMPYVALFEGVRRDKRLPLAELSRQSNAVGQERYQRFFYQEALRNLYTSLRFLSTETPLRSVAITSSVPAEGKSLLNVLLAKTLSELGQRVLLVDADLRRPQIHQRLGLDNPRGLSNLLTDEGLSWRELVQQVPDHPGWSVLTAGRRPPDPPRLLSSERMAQVVHTLADSNEFDLIIYDTPPAMGLADAALVAQHLEGMMLLVSLDRVDRELPGQALLRIREAGVPLLGVVTNSPNDTVMEGGIYGYGYGRYGSYGHGYGLGRYDVGMAYSHYSGDGDGNGDGDGETPALAAGAQRSRLRRWWRAVNSWLDR